MKQFRSRIASSEMVVSSLNECISEASSFKFDRLGKQEIRPCLVSKLEQLIWEKTHSIEEQSCGPPGENIRLFKVVMAVCALHKALIGIHMRIENNRTACSAMCFLGYYAYPISLMDSAIIVRLLWRA